MWLTRETRSALRWIALWMLAIAMLIGPLGLGRSVAIAAVDACGGTTCPCDADPDVDQTDGEPSSCIHNGEQGGDGDSVGCDHDADQEQCPEGCPNCGCCPGLVASLASAVVSMLPVAGFPSELDVSLRSPATASVSGVFRPPRRVS
jgi:hypothetical protein